MSGITITDAKVVTLCSKCRKEADNIPKFKDGTIVPDSFISCLNNAFGSCKAEKEHQQ